MIERDGEVIGDAGGGSPGVDCCPKRLMKTPPEFGLTPLELGLTPFEAREVDGQVVISMKVTRMSSRSKFLIPGVL